MKPLWIDTHIHISDHEEDGTFRKTFINDLQKLMESTDADLRFIVSGDTYYQHFIRDDAAGMMACSKFIHDVTLALPGKVYGACIVNPNFPREADAVMRKCFEEWGFVMLGEMLPYSMRHRLADERTVPLLKLAAHYDVPVHVHLGTYCLPGKYFHPGDSMDGIGQMADFLAAVRAVPEAKYIMAHAIGCGPTPQFIPWGDMFLDCVFGEYGTFPENFWIEIRDFHAKAVARTLREVPGNKILSGTDWTTRAAPFLPYGTVFESAAGQGYPPQTFKPCVASFMDFLRQAGAGEDAIRNIGSRNAQALFRI